MKSSVTESFKNILTNLFVSQQKRIIKKHHPKIVAVVGSVGKTSTKFAIATVLSQQLRVQVQNGNYNTPISVPFIFLGRSLPKLHNPFGWIAAWYAGEKIIWGKYPYDVVIVELGTDKPGDIADFKDKLRPDISVVTAISEEHMEFFGTLDAVAAEELTISQFSDTLVINVDDVAAQYINAYITNDIKQVNFGFETGDYIVKANPNGAGYNMQISKITGHIDLNANVQLVAKHSIKAIAAAVVVADLLGIEQKTIEKGMAAVTAPAGRMQLLKGIKGSTIIDDTYNASPLAVEAALQTLYEKDAKQKIALLGNMNELGDTSQTSHESIAKLCDPKQLDLVVTLGPDANKFLAPIAKSLGCNVVEANSPYEAADAIKTQLKEGALILAKGSQNKVFAEEAVKQLLADPADASKLVRQNNFWLVKKATQFTPVK